MPHGLGEDPLSRQRKSRRRAATRLEPGTGAPSPIGPSFAPSIGERSTSAGHLPARPTNYNDVFFKKRTESDIAPQPTTSAPSVPAVAPDAHEAPSTAPLARSEPVPEVRSAEPPVQVLAVTMAPSPSPESQPPAAPEPSPAPQVQEQSAGPTKETNEGGLLKRIFGRFHR